MNEQIIKDYEADLSLFCGLAADSQIEADGYNTLALKALCEASAGAFKLAACQMLYRLESLSPVNHPFSSLLNRDYIINTRIDIIRERRVYNVKKT